MNPSDAYKLNSKLPQLDNDNNQEVLVKIITKIELCIVTDKHEKLRETISLLFDYINIEDNSDDNNPVMGFVKILFFLYNNSETERKDNLILLTTKLKKHFE